MNYKAVREIGKDQKIVEKNKERCPNNIQPMAKTNRCFSFSFVSGEKTRATHFSPAAKKVSRRETRVVLGAIHVLAPVALKRISNPNVAPAQQRSSTAPQVVTMPSSALSDGPNISCFAPTFELCAVPVLPIAFEVLHPFPTLPPIVSLTPNHLEELVHEARGAAAELRHTVHRQEVSIVSRGQMTDGTSFSSEYIFLCDVEMWSSVDHR